VHAAPSDLEAGVHRLGLEPVDLFRRDQARTGFWIGGQPEAHLVVGDVTADAEHGVRGIKLARLGPEEEARHLRDLCSRLMDGELRSARDAEPMVVRLTDAATLTYHGANATCTGRYTTP
jgi:hypothetical protein